MRVVHMICWQRIVAISGCVQLIVVRLRAHVPRVARRAGIMMNFTFVASGVVCESLYILAYTFASVTGNWRAYGRIFRITRNSLPCSVFPPLALMRR